MRKIVLEIIQEDKEVNLSSGHLSAHVLLSHDVFGTIDSKYERSRPRICMHTLLKSFDAHPKVK